MNNDQIQGWQMVPVEHTQEMHSAYLDAYGRGLGMFYIWKAMLAAAPKPPVEDEVPCSTHPDAPHGFNRDSSHSLDRYVCDCEGWEAQVQDHGAAGRWSNKDNVADGLAEYREAIAKPQPSDDVVKDETGAFEAWWQSGVLNDGFVKHLSRKAFMAGVAYRAAIGSKPE